MAARTVSAPLAQLPNALTIARLIVIPIVAVLILQSDDGQSWQAAVLFGVAGITDQIDGFLARRWHVESAFGRIADPLADRLLIDVTVVLLWHVDRLPWVALLIPARDLVLIFATPLVVGRGYRFEVNMVGKIATWFLYGGIAFTMLTSPSTQWPVIVFWIGLGLAIVSALGYARKARAELAL